jgi:hypothetical protein
MRKEPTMTMQRTVEGLFIYLNAFLGILLFQELLSWPGWVRVGLTFIVGALVTARQIWLDK